MNFRTLLFLALLAAPVDGQSQDRAGTERRLITPEWVNELAEEARDRLPSLRAARMREEAAGYHERSIPAWKDPRLMTGTVLAEREMRQDEGDILFGVEQELPLFGKPGSERKVAAAERQVAVQKVDQQFQLFRRDLAQAFFALGLQDYLLEVDREDLRLLQNWTSIAEDRYGAGSGSQVEVLRLQNEVARQENEVANAELQRGHAAYRVSRILYQTDTNWPGLILPPPAGPINPSERVFRLALKNEPELQVLRQQVQVGEATEAMTRKARYPDLTLGLESRAYSRTGRFREGMITLSFNFPWFNERYYRSQLLRDQYTTQAIKWDVAHYESKVREEIHMLLTEIEEARREAELLETEMILRSRQTVENAVEHWTANRGSFTDVFEARKMLLQNRRDFGAAVARQYHFLAELILCCGLGDLEALQMLNIEPFPESKKETP